jgi:CMP-N,N'-diacetyllegionaminic acid synthase
MRRLAIIPARSGSKGLPGKNLAEINGESLVARAVRCARESEIFDAVVVSTDDADIQMVLSEAPGVAVLERPEAFATDSSPVTDAIKHVLGWFEDFDMLALLQPTSPTRTPEIVRHTVMSIDKVFDAAMTVTAVPVKYHSELQMVEGRRYYGLQGKGLRVVNRQSLPQHFVKSGHCYAVTTKSFMTHGLFGKRCYPILIDGPHINIDTPEDLEEARRLLG